LQHDIFDKQNQKTFRDVSVAEHYADMTALFPPELRALEKVRDVVRGRPIMDIGVGTGRTAPKLLELSTDYVGIDYSPEMIAKCRIRFPGVRFAVGDARRLDNYDTAHFALLMFSLNGIDYVRHSDRLVILRECHRLLDDGGVFLFSSHNEL
jgi:SAM-dependent methyltransferase